MSAQVLVAAVERATANFVERGQQIALENPEVLFINYLQTSKDIKLNCQC